MNLTTRAGREELRRHLAEQRPEEHSGCTDAFWLTAKDLLTLLDLADAGERDGEIVKTTAELIQDLCQRFPFVRQVLEQVTGVTIPPPTRAAAAEVAKGDGP